MTIMLVRRYVVDKTVETVVIAYRMIAQTSANCSKYKGSSRRVTHSPTLGKYNVNLLIFSWKMFILTIFSDMYVLESIFSQM